MRYDAAMVKLSNRLFDGSAAAMDQVQLLPVAPWNRRPGYLVRPSYRGACLVLSGQSPRLPPAQTRRPTDGQRSNDFNRLLGVLLFALGFLIGAVLDLNPALGAFPEQDGGCSSIVVH